jgi:hypothetical protein
LFFSSLLELIAYGNGQGTAPAAPKGVMWALQYGCLAAELVGSLHLKAVFSQPRVIV